MSQEFRACLKRRQIIKDEKAINFVPRQLKAAEEDLSVARSSFQRHDFKWCTVQSYQGAEKVLPWTFSSRKPKSVVFGFLRISRTYEVHEIRRAIHGATVCCFSAACYYVGFHAARALLYSQGYRERNHYCLIQAVKALFANTGKLDPSLIDLLTDVKTLREKADYELEYSEQGAKEALELAETFLEKAKELVS